MEQIENPWLQELPDEKPLCTCHECEGEFFEGDEMYYIDGNYYCESCISNARTYLEREDR